MKSKHLKVNTGRGLLSIKLSGCGLKVGDTLKTYRTERMAVEAFHAAVGRAYRLKRVRDILLYKRPWEVMERSERSLMQWFENSFDIFV